MLSNSKGQPSLARTVKSQATILGGTVASFWALEIFDQFLPRSLSLDNWGIHPRDVHDLLNIFFAPFLHVGFAHLIANTVPFVVLGWLIMVRSVRDFFLVSLIGIIVSGLGVWLFGDPNSVTVGASGVIFSYLGFLLLRGYFDRSWQSIAIALVVGFFFGGALWGMLPVQTGITMISWQAHLFGFIGGVLAAWLLTSRRRTAY
ncbi:rhomboid family intramembrane serine protease [Gloeobacter kilaueensis]|uniref:Peptidase S54 rhomboid domain-containing protein n=1 Tax=Gloeobacter kilaueensis (strain ATCC BAA-2537 / CCAP 1431/1 / ULC 316 / JS1) TaxID=1183438 RepID=U5QKE8_GLOK1|nr:rhomboid family intramembrane serine protease [Gloeobacter kilaueensis]AGY59381.1 hypothetical protein GKIL_3135 [Gloeobacter kilaueensis JS1]